MSKSFFYVGDSWNQLDFSGSTFDPNKFDVVNGVVTIKAGSITNSDVATNADIAGNKIAPNSFVKIQSDITQVVDSDIQLASTKRLALTNGGTNAVNGLSMVTVPTVNIANLQAGDVVTAGTVINFTHTDLVPDFGGGTQELTIDFSSTSSSYAFQFYFLEQDQAIAQLDNTLPGSDHILIMYRASAGGWLQTSFTVPEDVTVTANGLSSIVAHDNYWGFDYAIVGLSTYMDIASTMYQTNINSVGRILVNTTDQLAYMSDIGNIGTILDYINGEVI